MRYVTACVLGSAFCLSGLSAAASAATIAQFNFDTQSPDQKTYTDISGNGHDATANRALDLNTDNPFSISDPNPNNHSLEIPSNIGETWLDMANLTSFNPQNTWNMTLEGWVKPSAFHGGPLVHLGSSDGGTSNFEVGVTPDGKAYGTVYIKSGHPGGGTSTVDSLSTLPLNEWSHIAMVFDGWSTSTMTLYVNGVSQGSLVNGRVLPTNLAAGDTYIDYWNWGLADDIRISDQALAPSELGYYHSFSAPVPEPAMLGLLSLGMLLPMKRQRRA